jgi:hypothetical protein
MMRACPARRAIAAAAAERFALEPIEPRLLLDGAPGAVADAADNVEVALVRNGELVVFDQDGDQWHRRHFGDWIDAGDAEGLRSAATWRDPKDGRIYYALSTGSGLFVVLDDQATLRESVRNLTSEIAGAEPIASRITTFTSIDGIVHVAGLTASGDVVMYRQTGATVGEGGAREFVWEFINISDDHLAPQGIATPAFTSDLTSYVTAWNGLNIAGLDAEGDVHSVWWAPGMTYWSASNLSAITGAPAIAGNLTVYLTAWNGINIAGIDQDGKITVTWWVPQFEGNWVVTNFSDAFGSPAGGFIPGTIMAYTTPWGGLNVGAVSAEGGLTLYWWVPEFGGQWQIAANFIPGADDFSSDGIFGFTSDAGTINLVGANANGDIIRYHWRPGGEWNWHNLDHDATLLVDEYGGDDASGIVINPDLASLAGQWLVRVTTGFGPIAGDNGDGDGASMLLRADGVWLGVDSGFDFFGSTSSGGTWTYVNRTVTILLPDGAFIRAFNVGPAATQFVTRGITLTASMLQQMQQVLEQFDQQFPEANLVAQIEAAGGLEAILASIEMLWTRA